MNIVLYNEVFGDNNISLSESLTRAQHNACHSLLTLYIAVILAIVELKTRVSRHRSRQ